MGIDINALTTNADKLKECIDENEKQEQDRKEKNEQLLRAIERKVTKKEHKRKKPRGRDSAIKECIRLLKEGASHEVLTKLDESLRKQTGYYKYYVECFLPVLGRKIKQSDEVSTEIKGQVRQVISNITNNSIICSQVEDHTKVETSNRITNTSAQLLKAIEKRSNSKFKKHLKECSDISNVKNEEGKNILHLIASLEGKLKLKFLSTLIKTATKENLIQLIDGENRGKTPLQEALINKITEGKHESHTIGSNDNTLRFLVKLLKHGAKPDQLELPQKVLQSLDEKQKLCHLKLLEKLEESVRQYTLEQKVNIKNKTKEVAAQAINATDSNGNYLLHSAIKNNDKRLLEKLLQNGADIDLQDSDGNNCFHLIVKPETELKLGLLNILLKAGQEKQLIKAINDKNNNNQTPLHLLLQHMQKKSKKSSLVSFEDTNRYKTLELLLKNGADITAEDREGNNVLHYIASLEGKQKVICLDLILELSKNNLSFKAQLSEAIKTKNQEERTPLQVALIKKAEKGEHLSQKNIIFDPAINYDNTTKFCARLLQNGANPDSLVLRDEKFHTDNYYLVLRNLKDYRKPLHAGRKEAQELKEELEEKYHCGTASKKCQSGCKKAGSAIEKTLSATRKALSAIGKYMDPASRTRELLTIIITTTVVAVVAFAFFQGQIGVGAAVSMIAIAGVICLTLTLGFNGIKKLFGDSTDKVKNFVDNGQQNLGNDSTDLAAKEQQSQSKDTESPNSRMEDISTKQHYMGNQITVPAI